MTNGADEAGERIARLLAEIRATATERVTERVEELVGEIVDLYGAGLARVVALSDRAAVEAFGGDALLGALFVLHGLHPDGVRARVQQALERVMPYLASHAGGVTLTSIDPDGVVRLKLEGTCTSCASSSDTVSGLLERAVHEAAPEIVRVAVETAPAPDPDDGRLVRLGRRPRAGGAP